MSLSLPQVVGVEEMTLHREQFHFQRVLVAGRTELLQTVALWASRVVTYATSLAGIETDESLEMADVQGKTLDARG